MKHKGIRLALPMLFLLTLVSVAGVLFYAYFMQRKTVVISHDSGIYHDAIEVSVETTRTATILYTMNGETPTLDNPNAREYTEPIFLPLGEDTSTYSIKFICIYMDRTFSEVYTRDYIIEENPERFTTDYVVSITGYEDSLLGYEEGIFVRGRQYDEFMAANPDVDTLGTVIPANYLSDKEVHVHAAIFTKDGTPVINQNCGVKIYGNITRAKNQKSFRLIARTVYDGVNEFTYPLLPNLVSDNTNTVIDEFQRLSLHNSGNDHGYGFVRTQLIGELARRAGFPDVLVSESATVYVNGVYQGVYWLQNTFDDRYFKEKYGEYNGEIVVCEGTLSKMAQENVENEYEQAAADDYNEFCAWIQDADLQDEENWKRVCDTIDLNNLAQYMAIEYFVDNSDWPNNNVKVYRYACAEGEEYQEGSVRDGRYRYLLYDTDYGMGLKFLGWYGGDVESRRLETLVEIDNNAILFCCLLNRQEFKDLFVNALLCIMNESFSLEEVAPILEEFNEKRYEELRYMVEDTTLLKDSLWESDDNGMMDIEWEWAEIRYFAENRYKTVVSELDEKWKYGDMVDVAVSLSEQGNIKIGGLDVGQDFDGYWLENCPMEIACETSPGVVITGYNVNSQYAEGTVLNILPKEWAKQGEKIVIEPVVQVNLVESLHIHSYDIDGSDDYVILENNGQTEVLLSDYYITDSKDELSKGSLSEVILQPGEQFIIYGAKYSGECEENSIRLPFSWNGEETVLLVHHSKGIVEEVTR